MFSTGVWFKVWGVSNKGNYSEVDCSTSVRNKTTGNFETDFTSKFVRFVGKAHAKNPQPNERIKVTSCAVQNCFEKDGQRQYLKNPTYLVYDFERDGDNNQPRVSVPPSSNSTYMPNAYGGNMPDFAEIPMDDSLPF